MAKIKSIKRRKYVGKVHDITVEGIHAYNIEGLSVHNSAVSSLVLYVLGVIKVDPIKYDLIFERFLNPDRISPPDVDLDFDYDRRPEIIRYFSDKYGDDHCCQIGTCNTIKAKGAVRNVAKVIDVGNDWTGYEKEKKKNPDLKPPKTFKNSLDLGDRFSKMIPNVPSITLDEAYAQEEAFRGAMNRYPKLFDLAKQVEGVHSYSGVHASGLIICKDPVRDHVPLRLSKGVISSQFDGPEVEDLGLLKFDILGLKTLTVVENTVKLIKERHGIDLDVDLLEPDDPKVFKLFYGGYPNMDLRGVFQFESDIMIRLLENMHADRFEDLIVANALNRPGPMRAKINGVPMPNLYCNYKHGKQEVKYLHPKLGEVLKDTYGIMCFQENIMKVAQVLAGFTGGQADTLRKAVGKKKPELLKQQRDLFVDGCIANDIPKDIAIKIFEQIDFFAGYGFNRCLAGDTTVKNKSDGKIYTLEDLADGSYGVDKDNPIVLDSYVDGELVEDELVEVFETGEKEVYGVELDNGMIIKCTLDHKFICADSKKHTVQEIMDEDLEILYEE